MGFLLMAPSVTLQFCREARLSSMLIAWFSAGTLSHVDAVLPEGLLGAFERETRGYPSGVFIRQPGYIDLAAQVRVTIPCTDAQRADWLYFLRQQIGKAYDWKTIFGFATGRFWLSPNKWICSELQAAALEKAGIIPPLYLQPSKITPVGLLNTLSALPGAVITTIK